MSLCLNNYHESIEFGFNFIQMIFLVNCYWQSHQKISGAQKNINIPCIYLDISICSSILKKHPVRSGCRRLGVLVKAPQKDMQCFRGIETLLFFVLMPIKYMVAIDLGTPWPAERSWGEDRDGVRGRKVRLEAVHHGWSVRSRSVHETLDPLAFTRVPSGPF